MTSKYYVQRCRAAEERRAKHREIILRKVRIALGVVAVLGMALAWGSFTAADHGTISYGQCIAQSVIGMAAMACGVFGAASGRAG